MRKIYSLLCAALASMSVNAQNANLVLSTPNTGIDYQVFSLSPNGKWACGSIYDGSQRGFLWNLVSNEITELSVQGEESLAMKVSNDGVVSGAFQTTEGTPNNVPVETYGIWKDGKWTALEIDNEANNAHILRDGYAATISYNNKFIAGIGGIGDDYFPVFWKEGNLEVIDEISGSVYDVSDDGKILCGWTTHPVKKNRTCVIWKLGEDGKYKKTFMDLDSQWSAGPFCVATDISTNNRYVVGFNRVWDLQTDKYVEHDFSEAFSGFELTGVTNKGEAYGYEDNGDFPGGAERKAIKVGLDGKKVELRQLLIDQGVNLDKYPYIQRATGISDNEETYAFVGYDDAFFPHSIIVKLNVDTMTMAPVALKNRSLEGINANRLSWKAPLRNNKALKGYNVYRDGKKINSSLINAMEYVDNALNAGEYTYAVTAVYDGKESEKSEVIVTKVTAKQNQKPRNLLALQSSFNDVRLVWESPYSNLPSISYYTSGEAIASVGGGGYSFEAAIAARQQELDLYKKAGYQITQISFVPKSRQKSWTVKFYTSDNDDTPIYSEVIPNEGLVYGIENYFTLKTPLSIPEGKELIMAIDIDATGFGGYNVMGMAPIKADPRYSDLIRQKGEKDFYSMYESGMNSEEGAYEYNICWAMAIHFGKANEKDADNVKQYIVSANGKEVCKTAEKKYRLNGLAEGQYTFDVVAEYNNGKLSAPVSSTLNLVPNKSIYKPIVASAATELSDATLSWATPVDNDAATISFANTPNSGGLKGSAANQYSYMAATRYFGDKLKNYEDFEITGFKFFPLSDADYTFILKINGEEATSIALENGTGYTKNKWNTVKLETPIKINRHDEYMLILDCYDVTPNEAPLGIDSEIGYPNVSDLYSNDDGETFNSLIYDGGKDGNWMLGLEVASTTPKQLPVEGYNVYLFNQKVGEAPANATSYTLNNLEEAPYQARVNAIYKDFGEVKGKNVTFVINLPSGIEAMQNNALSVTKNANAIEVKGGNVTAVEAYNMAGALVAQSNSNVLGISALSNGVYVLKIKADGKTVSTKISINK